MSEHIEKILKILSAEDYKPLSGSELKKALGIDKKNVKRFYKDLKKLRNMHKIRKLSRNRFVLSTLRREKVVRGVLKRKHGKMFIHNEKEELQLPRLINSLHAVSGDEVLIKIGKKAYGYMAEVLKVYKRKNKDIIGYLVNHMNSWMIEPIDKKLDFKIIVKNAHNFQLQDGYLALVNVTKYPKNRKSAQGEIVKIYGDPNDDSIDKDVVIDKFHLPYLFSEDVAGELEKIKEPDEKNFKNRDDFRSFYTVTIDGEDAKDFDDAIDIEQIDTGYRLFVHIADVSHYVKKDSFLDKEALRRGFSVYFPGFVIPMLPHKLSDDICSLVPDKDRLALSCIMEFDERGNMKKYRFTKSVIRNKNRLTYKKVQSVLDNQLSINETCDDKILLMSKFAKILRSKRFKDGSLDLDIAETEIVVEQDKVVKISQKPRLFAHFIIEEFMLAANLATADFLSKRYETFIRRIHDNPDEEKLFELKRFLKKLGIQIQSKDGISSKELENVIEGIKDEKMRKMVSYLILRSLKRAEYSTEKKGHFALNFKNYTHFTSPIRRYPDLENHRMIKSSLKNGLNEQETWDVNFDYLVSEVQNREIATESAEFYMKDIKSASFMRQYLGEKFSGTIINIIPSGFFVRLDDFFVEGFVPARTLKDDYYEYIEDVYAMVGKRKGKMYRITESVDVVVTKVDKFAAEIDLAVV